MSLSQIISIVRLELRASDSGETNEQSKLSGLIAAQQHHLIIHSIKSFVLQRQCLFCLAHTVVSNLAVRLHRMNS